MDFIERLDRAIEGGVQQFVERVLGSHGGTEFLETYDAALEHVTAKTHELGGRRVFSFRYVDLVLAVADGEQIAPLSQFLAQRQVLLEDLHSRLASRGCERPVPLRVDVRLVSGNDARLNGRHFSVTLSTDLPPQPPLTLSVRRGPSSQSKYRFTQSTINLGRQPEVVDGNGRLIRRNHVAFSDDGEGRSVSRLHAHIAFDLEIGAYRVFDDQSALGTRLCRGDKLIDVAAGQAGAWLRPGDEIHLGEVRLAVAIGVP